MSPDHNCLMKNQQSFVSSSTGCDVLFSGFIQYIFIHIGLLEIWMSYARCGFLCLYPIWDSLSCCFNLFFSVQFSCSVVSYSLRPHGLQHTKPPCPSPTPRVYINSCPLSQWYHLTISSSVIPFSSCPQAFPASGSFQMSQLFTSGGQNTGVSASASVLPMNTQDWFSLGWTDWISLQSKGLSRLFSNTTVQKHQFLSAQLSLWPTTLTSIHDYWKNHSLD